MDPVTSILVYASTAAVQSLIKRLRSEKAATVDPSTLAKIQLRIDRLQEFEGWMREDPPLAQLIDTSINERVRKGARNQAVLSFFIAIVFLIAGWLLNALSPINFITLFNR